MAEGKRDYHLTSDEVDYLVEMLAKLGWADFECEICHHKEWGMGNKILGMIPTNGLGTFTMKADFPYITMICHNCGNSKLVNAEVLDLRDFKVEGEGEK